MVNRFFSFDNFSHKELFPNDSFPWEILANLFEYTKNQSYKIEVPIPPSAEVIDENFVSIGRDTIIEPHVYIQGPCIIGKRCQLRHGACIRGPFICGDDCVIGHSSEVKNSIFLNRAKAPHFAYVGDSILGNDTNLGAGVRCANFRLDEREVFIRYKNRLIETKLKKMGAILGDETQIGCNSVLNPGTLIRKSYFALPLSSLRGVLL